MIEKKHLRLMAILILLISLTVNPVNVAWAGETGQTSSIVAPDTATTQGQSDTQRTPETPTPEAPTTTEQPTTEASTTTEQPTTEVPTTTEQPTTEAPTTTEQPTTEVPTATEQSTTEAPSTTEVPTATEVQEETTAPAAAGNNSNAGYTPAVETEATTEADPRESYTVKEKPYDDENRIEQLQVIKPKIRAYLYIEDLGAVIDENCIFGSLGGKECETVSVRSWKQSGMGINYYVVLDISASMEEDYFEEVKVQIDTFGKKYMTSFDTLTVYVAGDEEETVIPVIDMLTANDSDEITEKIEAIETGNNDEQLDLAIEKIANDIHSKRQIREEDFLDNRDIVIAFSGGKTSLSEETTGETAREALKAEGITLFYFAPPADDENEGGSKIEQLAGITGGKGFETEKDDLASQVNILVNNLQDVYVVDFMAEDNISDGGYNTFSVSVYMDDREEIWEYASRDVLVSRYIKDTEPPVVEDILLTEDNRIEITYSESVLGADDVSSYRLLDENDKEIPVSSADYIGNRVYSLKFAEDEVIYKGKYKLHINNITDNTVEKNKLEKTEYDFELENAPEYKEKKKGFIYRFWWIFIVIFLLIAAVVFTLLFIKKKKMHRKTVISSSKDFGEKQSENVREEPKGQRLTLVVNSDSYRNKQIDVRINGSIIVGRSDLCDVFLPDACLSRQHFAIEFDDDSFYVMDLDTTNGTVLNGALLKNKRRLENGDKISIGSLNIVVRW